MFNGKVYLAGDSVDTDDVCFKGLVILSNYHELQIFCVVLVNIMELYLYCLYQDVKVSDSYIIHSVLKRNAY